MLFLLPVLPFAGVVCPVPDTIPHGFITFAVKREHSYKERVKYGCEPNYVMDGAPEIECEKTGRWSPKPVCRGESYSLCTEAKV